MEETGMERKEGREEDKTKVLAPVCTHPAFFKGMCVSCGARPPVETSGTSSAANKVIQGGHALHMSQQEAFRVQGDRKSGLQSVKKLALILDLDNTLLHASPCDTLTLEEQQAGDLSKLIISDRVGTYFVKFRPYLQQFLNELEPLYQFSVYTHGVRMYAEGVCQLMDKEFSRLKQSNESSGKSFRTKSASFFGNRIVSRSEDDVVEQRRAGLTVQSKSLAKIFMGDWSMAAVLDDRDDVWEGEQRDHVLNIKPYMHFDRKININNEPGMIRISESIVFPEEKQEDDELLLSVDVLKRVHRVYYNEVNLNKSPPSVGSILGDMRRSVLSNVCISFSQLIPINTPQPPTSHRLWVIAKSLGAFVTLEPTEYVTHLLTLNIASVKARVCKDRKNVHIVNPDWLLRCLWSLDRVDEKEFYLDDAPSLPVIFRVPPPEVLLPPPEVLLAPPEVLLPPSEVLLSSLPPRDMKHTVTDAIKEMIQESVEESRNKRKRSESEGSESESSDDDEWLASMEGELSEAFES